MSRKRNEFDELLIGLLVIFVVIGGSLWLIDKVVGFMK